MLFEIYVLIENELLSTLYLLVSYGSARTKWSIILRWRYLQLCLSSSLRPYKVIDIYIVSKCLLRRKAL